VKLDLTQSRKEAKTRGLQTDFFPCSFTTWRLCVEKSIYLQASQRVGQWSDVVSIPVAGSGIIRNEFILE